MSPVFDFTLFHIFISHLNNHWSHRATVSVVCTRWENTCAEKEDEAELNWIILLSLSNDLYLYRPLKGEKVAFCSRLLFAKKAFWLQLEAFMLKYS